MEGTWERVQSGPPEAEQTVLLLPGGMCSARSYAELMAEPALAGVRTVAVTMPGHAGAPAPDDFSVEAYARITAELAHDIGADVVVGFSMGATVAYEMVVSGAYARPVVLLGVSLSTEDEPAFLRGVVRVGAVAGSWPFAVLKKGAASMVKHAAVSPERRAELQEDFAKNSPRAMHEGLKAYLRWLARDDDPARRLCEAGVPAWVVHAEKGDGGLTTHERATLERCPQVEVITIPGSVAFIPNERPGLVADLVLKALAIA